MNGFSQCQDNWAIKAGSDSSEYASSIVTDNNGNIYITGGFKDHTLLDTIALNGYGKIDIFLLNTMKQAIFNGLNMQAEMKMIGSYL